GKIVNLERFISGVLTTVYSYWCKITVEHVNAKFAVERSGNLFVRTISDAMVSDVGIYYCSKRDYDTTNFGNGIFLIYEDTRTQHVVQQAVSETVQPRDTVTLNCTIHTETCAGEHSVYWFRHGSGESHPGIIYTHGDRSDQCEKSPEAGSPTQSCVYNLPKRNLSLSDAGTYYCAVASCGEILFGKGTKLDVERGHSDDPQMRILVLLSIIRTGVLLSSDHHHRHHQEIDQSKTNKIDLFLLLCFVHKVCLYECVQRASADPTY
uniref:Ig-like domain-containing protein n=1 Tax=Hucho hucho TaxID=62062 RepID=A0A4W5P4A3_9TELE